MTQTSSKQLATDIAKLTLDIGAEMHYLPGVGVGDSAYLGAVLTPEAMTGVMLGWNYGDGAYAIALGMIHLKNGDHAKGVVQLLSGIQIFSLSYNPVLAKALGLKCATVLAPTAFAISMLCDLICAAIDFVEADKCLSSFDYWHESQVETKKLLDEKNDEENPESEVSKIKAEVANINWMWEKGLLHYSEYGNEEAAHKRIVELKLKKDMLVAQKNQCDRYCNYSKEEWLKGDLQAELKQNRNNKLGTMLLKSASFIGMTCLAITSFVSCPPLMVVGIVIVSLVAATYAVKNGAKIYQLLNRHGFFNRDNNETPKFIPTSVGISPR